MQEGEPSKMGQLMDYHSPDSATLTKQMDCYCTMYGTWPSTSYHASIVRLGNNKQWTLSRLSKTSSVYCKNLNHPKWHCSSTVQWRTIKNRPCLKIYTYISITRNFPYQPRWGGKSWSQRFVRTIHPNVQYDFSAHMTCENRVPRTWQI
jgi:hypothetical protein